MSRALRHRDRHRYWGKTSGTSKRARQRCDAAAGVQRAFAGDRDISAPHRAGRSAGLARAQEEVAMRHQTMRRRPKVMIPKQGLKVRGKWKSKLARMESEQKRNKPDER